MEVKLRICKAVGRTAKRFVRPAMLACLLLPLSVVWNQNARAQGTTGSITGTVTDSTSAVISGATVTITQLSTNEAHIVTTSDLGTYSVTQLPPGTYSVKVNKGGFQGYQQEEIVLTIDQIAQVNATLQVGSEQQTVTVTGEAPEIQTEASSVGLVVDSQTIQNTPLNGHTSIIGLLALAPGVRSAFQENTPASLLPIFFLAIQARPGKPRQGTSSTEIFPASSAFTFRMTIR